MQIKTQKDLKSNNLGATKYDECTTCHQSIQKCCGHFGYIQLNEYFVNPIKQEYLEDKLKTFCIYHKRYEEKPCQIVQVVKFDQNVNNKVIKYYVCPLYCMDDDSVYDKYIQSQRFVAINPKYLQELLHENIFLNVVPVPCLTTRQTLAAQGLQTTNSTNIYNQIYEIILQLSSIKIDWIKGRYIFLNQQEQEYCKLLIACRLIMFNDSAKSPKAQIKNQMLKYIGKIQNIQDVCSLCAAAITKYGFFRQAINSIRVFKSTRTVITGEACIQSDQVIMPYYMASEITVPVKVNYMNFQKCIEYINNYPNYPYCKKVFSTKNQMFFTLTPHTKQNMINNLQPGDIIYRHVINNDICLVNRYPSIREESFGCHKVIVKDIKTIQFNLQVVKKMTADFDGDEMQLYFLFSPDNNLEIALLSSMQRQFITYENGFNLIGGSPDLAAGIYLAQQLHKEKELTSIIKAYIPKLTYQQGNINIINGEVLSFDKDLADKDSRFLTHLQAYYGQTKTLQIMDDVTRFTYTLIRDNGSTLYSILFKQYPVEYKQLSYDSMEAANKLNQYYLSQDVYNEQVHQVMINNELQKYQLQQVEQIQPLLHMENTFFSKLVKKFQEQLRSGIICLGQVYNENNDRITNNIRTLPCYPKFSPKVEYQGFITENFTTGLSQTSLFLDSISGRKQLYNKGNAVEKDGYTARRLAKGANNVIAGFNGIIFSDSQTIISFQYGQYSYDCRCFQKVVLNLRDIKFNSRRLELAKYIKQMEFNLSQDNPRFTYNPNIITFHLPFIPMQKTITEKELQYLLDCRMTENMTDEFRQIIYSQVFYFYIYCVLTMDIVEHHEDEFLINKLYIQSLLQPGDMVGLKASHASTQPYTQTTLHSIHHSFSGKTEIEIEKLTGSARFMELLTNMKGPITVQFKLLPGYNVQQFIKQYQLHTINQLQPVYDVYCTNNIYTLEINFSVKILGLYNIQFTNILYTLQQYGLNVFNIEYNKPNIKLLCVHNKNNYIKLISFIHQNVKITNQSKIFIRNLKLKKNTTDVLEGNIDEDYLINIYKLRQIDPYSIYCSNPHEYQNLFGIEKCNQIIHLELYHNLTTDESTKEVQGVHVKLLTDVLTQTGQYKNFTSACYKGQAQKDIIQLMLFEYSIMFIQKYLENEQEYATDNIMNAQLFGNTPLAGSTFCEYYNNDYLYQQDIKKIYGQIQQ